MFGFHLKFAYFLQAFPFVITGKRKILFSFVKTAESAEFLLQLNLLKAFFATPIVW